MKTLQILRHAKTERLQLGQKDFDRRLTERGLGQMADLRQNQHENLSKAQRVIVSSAKRTRMTHEQIETLLTQNIQFDDQLYLASMVTLAKFIQQQKDSLDNILLIGHNDGLSDFASYLMDDYITLPTSGYLVLDMEIDHWAHLSKGIAHIRAEFYSDFR